MKVKAFSKINLGLSISKEEFDFTSKHKIKSLFLKSYQYYDELDILENDIKFDQIVYNFDNKKATIHNCIIKRTLDYLRQQNLIKKYYRVVVWKNILPGSGLGLGSSDAACVIRCVLENEGVELNNVNTLDIALNLGSDIPFFLANVDCAIVSGFGEIIEPIEWKNKVNIQIHLNFIETKTKYVFQNYINNNKINEVRINNFKKIISEYNAGTVCKDVYNDLQDSAFSLDYTLKEKYLELLNQHDFVIMSGSGSTMISVDKKSNKVRTRYAPSPTGYFHIGGARTALFSYLYAKHFDGDFIVRIEDTDIERNVEGGIESQLENLKWMGIVPDESVLNPGAFGPYIQSAKLDRYKSLAEKLVSEGKAYYCFCTEQQLEEDRQNALANHQTPRYSRRCRHLSNDEIQTKLESNISKVIRLKTFDEENYEWDDLVRGHISIPGTAMTDPVILKSNGVAMYNFAVVIDDYDMQISHVLRGEEHVSNTPYQLAIKSALGFESDIQYGHLSVIIDETGKKLSKRNKDLKQFISDYREMGYIPEALDNFLALLGWVPSNNVEVLTLKEIIQQFDVTNVSKSPTFFDYKKLEWIGNEYFKRMDKDEYLKFVKPFINLELNNFLKENLDILLLLFKDQISYASQINGLIIELFGEKELVLTDEMLEILSKNKDVIMNFQNEIQNLEIFNEENIKVAINNVKNATSKKGKDLFMPIRIASTWMMHGPELAKMIYLTNKERVLFNIDKILLKI